MRKILLALTALGFLAGGAQATPLTIANANLVNPTITGGLNVAGAQLTTPTVLSNLHLTGNGSAVDLTPWNWGGYQALAIGSGMLTFSGDGNNVGLMYTHTTDSAYKGLLLGRTGWGFVDSGLFFLTQSSPASNAACDTGATTVDSSYLYYCVATNKWGRIPWQTGY